MKKITYVCFFIIIILSSNNKIDDTTESLLKKITANMGSKTIDDFKPANSISSLLGFKNTIYISDHHSSENTARK